VGNGSGLPLIWLIKPDPMKTNTSARGAMVGTGIAQVVARSAVNGVLAQTEE
jgi:hypothetical protein